MWWARLVAATLLIAFSAAFAWYISQPFDPTLAAVAIGVLAIGMGASWLLSGTPFGRELQLLGLGRLSTTRERRISFALMIVAIVSISVMDLVYGRQPPFLPAFVWLIATFVPLTVAQMMVHRTAQAI